MRKIFVSILAILPLYAHSKNLDEIKKQCGVHQALATQVMSARQAGVAVNDMMTVSKGDALVDGLIVEAFKEPAYSTKSFQDKASNEFGSKVYLACYEQLKKKYIK